MYLYQVDLLVAVYKVKEIMNSPTNCNDDSDDDDIDDANDNNDEEKLDPNEDYIGIAICICF